MSKSTGGWKKRNVVFLFLLTVLVVFSACSREINPIPEPEESELIPVKIRVIDDSGNPVEDVSIAFTDITETPHQDIGLNVERTDGAGYTETTLKEKASYDVALVQNDEKTIYTEVKIPDDLKDDMLEFVYND